MYSSNENKSISGIEKILLSLLSALAFFLFYYITRQVIASIVMNVIFLLNSSDYELAYEIYSERINAISAISGLFIIISLILFFKARGKSFSKEIHLNKVPFSLILLAFLIGVSLNFVTTYIISLLPDSLLNSYKESVSTVKTGPVFWAIFASVIVAPILEEIVFRGLILTRLSRGFGNILAVILTSLCFGAVHGHIVWSTYAFLLGTVLGLLFVRSRSLKSSISMHLGFNAVSLLSYIDLTSFTHTGEIIMNTILSFFHIGSIPISVILIIIFFSESANIASKKEPL